MENSTVSHMEELISYSQKCAETWPWFIQMRESCPDVVCNEVRPFSCGRERGASGGYRQDGANAGLTNL